MATVLGSFDHGGGVERAARELGLSPEEILDFSASINPLGAPAGVLRAVEQVLPGLCRYPEIDAASLVEALAAHHRLAPAHFLPGNGSTELIYYFPRILRPRRALVVTPAFSEYERGLGQAAAAIDRFPLLPEEDFALDPARLLHAVAGDTDLLWLANPGNPSGAGLDPELIEELAHAVREQALVVVDEAFVDFCPQRSVVGRVPDHDNLYVLRSFTKFYAIPGLRAGYLVGPVRGVALLAEAREPWVLSAPALAAAKACLKEEEFRQRTLAILPALRRPLAEGLAGLGLTVFPAEANYLLARLERAEHTAAGTAGLLRQRGILVRDCASFPTLDERYLRVAVRSEGENRRLLAELENILGAC